MSTKRILQRLSPYQLTGEGFDADPFRVHSFAGKETISEATPRAANRSKWSFPKPMTRLSKGLAAPSTHARPS